MKTQLVVDGRTIEAQWWERSRSPRTPIVLLHEGLGSVAMWRDVPGALARCTERPVMAYSRFGHGDSDPPATPHTVRFMHDEARVVPTILDAAAIPHAILLGHSDGGSIALICAAECPLRVDALILEAAHVFVEPESIASIARTTSLYASGGLRARLSHYHRDVDVAFRGWSDVWLEPQFLQWNLEEYLPRVSCPVLLIQGEDDEYGTLRQIDAIERQVAGPVDRLVLPDCGHSPHRENPDAVLAAVATFVKRYSRD